MTTLSIWMQIRFIFRIVWLKYYTAWVTSLLFPFQALCIAHEMNALFHAFSKQALSSENEENLAAYRQVWPLNTALLYRAWALSSKDSRRTEKWVSRSPNKAAFAALLESESMTDWWCLSVTCQYMSIEGKIIQLWWPETGKVSGVPCPFFWEQ